MQQWASEPSTAGSLKQEQSVQWTMMRNGWLGLLELSVGFEVGGTNGFPSGFARDHEAMKQAGTEISRRLGMGMVRWSLTWNGQNQMKDLRNRYGRSLGY